MNFIKNALALGKEENPNQILQPPIVDVNTYSVLVETPNSEIVEIEETHPLKNEITLPTDQLESIKRRILIGAKSFGIHQPELIANYVGISLSALTGFLKEQDIIESLKDPNTIACLTKSEIVAQLSVEAQNSPKGGDRLTALKLLMEYRGLTAPEGNSKSFSRIVSRFKR